MEKNDIRKIVRKGYGRIARDSCSCGSGERSCCSGAGSAEAFLERVGYSTEDLAGVDRDVIVGLACGNPLGHAKPAAGETVLDLGSGTGLDCFIAAKAVGPSGSVIGVDMTPEMVERARENARSGGYDNVEFRLGEIESLPAADGCVDVVVSNCVINLSPDKARVFREAFRVLRPGGRLVVSDIVLLEAIPEALRESEELLVACIANASMKPDYLRLVGEAGFRDVQVLEERTYPFRGSGEDSPVASIIVRATKR